jgi:hypothetical protein
MFIIVIVILYKNRAFQCFNVYEPLSHLRDGGGMYLGRLKYTVKKMIISHQGRISGPPRKLYYDIRHQGRISEPPR